MGTLKDQQRFLAQAIEAAITEEQRPLLFVTANTHLALSDRECRSRGERFFYYMHRRCFRGARFASVGTPRLIRIFGTLERGPQTGQPHLHVLVWIHPAARERFIAVAAERWRAVSPGGSAHLRHVEDPALSAPALAAYLTKDLDRPEFRDGFFTEADIGLPPTGGRIRRSTSESSDLAQSLSGRRRSNEGS